MNKQQQIELASQFFNTCQDLISTKGDDYANDDRLSNFKKVAMMTNQTPGQVALSLIGIKVARLSELLSGKEPKNESVNDTLIDLANYSFILFSLLNEVNQAKTDQTEI